MFKLRKIMQQWYKILFAEWALFFAKLMMNMENICTILSIVRAT
jgi:hypothetical protein